MKNIKALNDLGRVQLSKSFFMREFLYSEIANFHGMPNIPEDPDLAVKVGRSICTELLEPLQDAFGRIAIRSAYRSKSINGFGNQMQKDGKKDYNCSSNEANYAKHIWEMPDKNGNIGGTVCIVVPSFIPLYESGVSWTELALWIHDHLPYSSMYFFPINAAFNLTWSETPERTIKSYVKPRRIADIPGVDLSGRSHEDLYQGLGPILQK